MAFSSSFSITFIMLEELAKSHGYPFETHEIFTEDGYLLTLHRIPHGRKINAKKEYPQRPVALIFPGLLAASDSWLFRGPGKDLPYVTADGGYDTWICNGRGNVYSRRHRTLRPDTDLDFWKFSIHEHGVYDLPASIDYILQKTNQSSVFGLGYSIGATVFLIMCTEKPEYNAKIKLFNSLAGVGSPHNSMTPLIKFWMSMIPPSVKALEANGVLEVFPQSQFISKLGRVLCNDEAPTQPMCTGLLFSVVGMDNEQFNNSLFTTLLTYFPAGTSIYVLQHIHQIFQGQFQPLVEQHPLAEAYNLSKITVPTYLYYGSGDTLITKEETQMLANKVPSIQGVFQVPHKLFNHMDFMWGKDSRQLLYNSIVKLMNKHR